MQNVDLGLCSVWRSVYRCVGVQSTLFGREVLCSLKSNSALCGVVCKCVKCVEWWSGVQCGAGMWSGVVGMWSRVVKDLLEHNTHHVTQVQPHTSPNT